MKNSEAPGVASAHESGESKCVAAVASGSALQTAVSQAIQAAIAAHIEEYSKHFPEQAWGKGALHARLLPAVMAVMPNVKAEPRGQRE